MEKTKKNKNFIWLLLILLGFLCFFVFYFHLPDYFTFEELKRSHYAISAWVEKYYVYSVLIFIFVCILAVLSSTPLPTFLCVVSGFFFGLIFGTLYVVIGTIAGSLLVFFTVRTTLGEWLAQRANPWMHKMRKGVQKNAFAYLLTLRMTPLFPIWIVNVIPALLRVPFRIFLATTLIGTIPGCFFYVVVGNSLVNIIDHEGKITFKTVFTSTTFILIIIVTFFSFLPIFIMKWQTKQKEKKNISIERKSS